MQFRIRDQDQVPGHDEALLARLGIVESHSSGEHGALHPRDAATLFIRGVHRHFDLKLRFHTDAKEDLAEVVLKEREAGAVEKVVISSLRILNDLTHGKVRINVGLRKLHVRTGHHDFNSQIKLYRRTPHKREAPICNKPEEARNKTVAESVYEGVVAFLELDLTALIHEFALLRNDLVQGLEVHMGEEVLAALRELINNWHTFAKWLPSVTCSSGLRRRWCRHLLRWAGGGSGREVRRKSFQAARFHELPH
mmetsp:Transcript_83723/g.179436  ORF Transcript_83723/g.179436 Transcript_83723/m.179436 type:complete len:252 (+) Transcript_83723:318-1073(+)